MSRILIVDDDYDVLRYCEGILSPREHEVIITTEPTRALKMLETHSIDLLIMDIVMPTMNGFDMLRELKKNEKNTFPILMLTARSAPKDVIQALELGATDYLVKPIDHHLLTAKIDSILGKVSKHDEIEFAQGAANAASSLTVKSSIVSLSEMGVRMHTTGYMDRNTHTKIESGIFQEIGINPNATFRVVGCHPIENDPAYHYEIYLSFIGLDEASMMKIRRWVYTRTAGAKKAA